MMVYELMNILRSLPERAVVTFGDKRCQVERVTPQGPSAVGNPLGGYTFGEIVLDHFESSCPCLGGISIP